MKKTLYTLGLMSMIGLCACAQNIAEDTNLTSREADMLIQDYEAAEMIPDIEGLPSDTTIEFVIEVEEGDSITIEEVESAMQALQRDLVAYAKKYLGTPYRYGATGPKPTLNWQLQN